MKIYRACACCGLKWNISNTYPSENVYICPNCEARQQKRLKGVR